MTTVDPPGISVHSLLVSLFFVTLPCVFTNVLQFPYHGHRLLVICSVAAFFLLGSVEQHYRLSMSCSVGVDLICNKSKLILLLVSVHFVSRLKNFMQDSTCPLLYIVKCHNGDTACAVFSWLHYVLNNYEIVSESDIISFGRLYFWKY